MMQDGKITTSLATSRSGTDMKLEVGKRYVRRNNTVTPPLRKFRPFLIDRKTLLMYDPEDEERGWMAFPVSKTEHEHDLMKPYEGDDE